MSGFSVCMSVPLFRGSAVVCSTVVLPDLQLLAVTAVHLVFYI